MSGLPLLFTASGPQATPPATLNAALIAGVAAEAPGYTASLPGLLISDLANTGTGALVVQDQARVDAVNSVTPYTANPFVLAAQGLVLGVPQGLSSNASVIEVFTGSPGYVIAPGFTVGDGTNQYVTQDGGTVGSGGTSQPIGFIATNSGMFAIPGGSVNQVITSVPGGFTLTVTNPVAGVPAESAETVEAYRARVLQGQQATCSGAPTMIKTLVSKVPGVQTRLLSVRVVGTLYEVICGGGDPLQVAGAIYQAVSTVGLLTGSTESSLRNVTATIFDAPDQYQVVYVNPPQQVVLIACTWNTNLPSFTASAAVDQLIVGAEAAYVNSVIVGQGINLLVLQEQVQAAVASVLDPVNLTTLQFAVTIDGTLTPPTAGTSVVPSDPESWFFCSPTGATSSQG
jgi:hypothetical protein